MFNSVNLSVLAYTNGFTMWHYKTKDTLKEVAGIGYFSEASNIIDVGNIIICNAAKSGTDMYVVRHAKDKSDVSITSMTTIGAV